MTRSFGRHAIKVATRCKFGIYLDPSGLGTMSTRRDEVHMTIRTHAMIIGLLVGCRFASAALAEARTPDEAAFRGIYKELVEINTTRSVGSCTRAAEAMRAHLAAAGIAAGDMQILEPADRPQDGSLIAVLHGRDRLAKPILLLAHLDVVEAKREEWD